MEMNNLIHDVVAVMIILALVTIMFIACGIFLHLNSVSDDAKEFMGRFTWAAGVITTICIAAVLITIWKNYNELFYMAQWIINAEV